MSNKGGNELEKSTPRKTPKGAASAAQVAAAAHTPAPAAAVTPASTGEKWSAENGLLLLKTFLRILEDRGERPSYEQIHEAMHGSIPDDISKEKVGDKLRNLKRRFVRAQARAAPPVNDPVYQLSERIWGGAAEAETPAAVTPKAKPTPKPKTVKTPDVVAPQEEEAPAAVTNKPTPKKKAHKPPIVASPQEEQEVQPAVTPKAKTVPKRKAEKTPVTAAPEAEQEVPQAVTPKAKPTPKRKADKKPVIAAPQEEQEASEVEEDTERPRKSPGDHDNTPAPKPAPKRKRKKTTDAAAPEEGVKVADEDARSPQVSPGDQNTTPALRPKKEKAKSKPLDLVATGHSSSELRELENRHMVAGMVRIVQQVYPEADEKLVFWALDGMEGPDLEEIKENWRQLQELKLGVASLTAQLVMKLTRAPR